MRLLLASLTCLAALAHDLEVTTQVVPPAVIVKSTYAGADPVPFAKVQVYSPGGSEFQNANTDRRGTFSFVPDAVGAWRVVIDDELGHRRELKVNIASLDGEASRTQPATSRVERALLGLSLLMGFTGFWYGFRNRKRT